MNSGLFDDITLTFSGAEKIHFYFIIYSFDFLQKEAFKFVQILAGRYKKNCARSRNRYKQANKNVSYKEDITMPVIGI